MVSQCRLLFYSLKKEIFPLQMRASSYGLNTNTETLLSPSLWNTRFSWAVLLFLAAVIVEVQNLFRKGRKIVAHWDRIKNQEDKRDCLSTG
jgi:hypothetical protein